MIRKVTCRQCGHKVRASFDKPECSVCGCFAILVPDYDLRLELASQKRVASQIAKKRRCRECGKSVGPNRYFVCSTCVLPHDRETECMWDNFAQWETLVTMDPLQAVPLTLRERMEAACREAVANER